MNVRKMPNIEDNSYATETKPLGKVLSSMQNALYGIKDKGQVLTTNIMSGAKQRPALFLGAALASGFLLGKLLRKKF